MSDYIGEGVRLAVCETCPNRIPDSADGFRVGAKPGEAEIQINETMVIGAYIKANSGIAHTFIESSTNMMMEDRKEESFTSAFKRCESPAKSRILQKLGIASPDCPALQEIFGDPTDANLVADYIENRGTSAE